MKCSITIDGTPPKAIGLTKAALKSAAELFAAKSSDRSGLPFREVTVVLQDDAQSDEVHRGIMGVEGATDVITQAYEAIPPEPEGVYGELYVNVDQAVRAAPRRRGWSAAKELLLYVAHGMDHLSGADDHSPEDYARMRRRELGWLRAIKMSVLAFAFAALTAHAAADDYSYVEYDYEHWYADAQATVVLPQGGGRMRRLGGGTARLGYYVSDFLAAEASASWAEDSAGLGLHGLWHWWGYEKLDPFFTFGADGWIEGQVGPSVGWGTFWHFDDNWSVRLDAAATLGVNGGAEMVYSLSLGLQYAF